MYFLPQSIFLKMASSYKGLYFRYKCISCLEKKIEDITYLFMSLFPLVFICVSLVWFTFIMVLYPWNWLFKLIKGKHFPDFILSCCQWRQILFQTQPGKPSSIKDLPSKGQKESLINILNQVGKIHNKK